MAFVRSLAPSCSQSLGYLRPQHSLYQLSRQPAAQQARRARSAPFFAVFLNSDHAASQLTPRSSSPPSLLARTHQRALRGRGRLQRVQRVQLTTADTFGCAAEQALPVRQASILLTNVKCQYVRSGAQNQTRDPGTRPFCAQRLEVLPSPGQSSRHTACHCDLLKKCVRTAELEQCTAGRVPR